MQNIQAPPGSLSYCSSFKIENRSICLHRSAVDHEWESMICPRGDFFGVGADFFAVGKAQRHLYVAVSVYDVRGCFRGAT